MAVKKQSFEASMKRLEEIVADLERGECGLDDSMKLFEEGAKLASSCSTMLDEAEQRVTLLLNPQTGEEVPFEGEAE